MFESEAMSEAFIHSFEIEIEIEIEIGNDFFVCVSFADVIFFFAEINLN